MILLSVRGISRQFDAEPVFRDVTFEVRTGEKIGLVGPNGTGKTTLLRILSDLDEADTGQIECHPSSSVALLEQEPDFSPGRTLIEEAKSGLGHLYRLQAQATVLAEQIAGESDPQLLERHQRHFDRLQEELRQRDAYNIDHRVTGVLAGLGFHEHQYERPLEEFSGGEHSRVLLARMLLRAPQVMLLDEPTNHLDIAATEWLESYLSRRHQAVVLVSHDRWFLDRVTNRTLEMHDGRLRSYPGNFSAYWKLREERNTVLKRTHQKQQDEIAKAEEFIRRNKYGQKHAQAADREKKLQRIGPLETQKDFLELSMTFRTASRSGDWVIDAVGIAKGFGKPLFRDVTLRIHRGDRIGVLGPNGSGKTTLLRTLLGELDPDFGTVRLGTGVKIGYFDQQLANIDADGDAIEVIRPAGNPDVTSGQLRNILARFGIRGDLALQKVGRMSGGERNKVALAKQAAADVNLLVLDEPTNHLDLWARASLESALKAFDGTLLFVSHDRYFLDRVATSVIVLEPDRWRFHEGNYSDYVAFVRNRTADDTSEGTAGTESADGPETGSKPAAVTRNNREKSSRRKRKFPYRKVTDLEAEIAEHEQLLEQLEADLVNPEIHRNGERIKGTTVQYDQTKAELESLYEHWEEAIELN